MNKAYNWGENMIVNVLLEFRVTFVWVLGGTARDLSGPHCDRQLKHIGKQRQMWKSRIKFVRNSGSNELV